ncbi:helix-turn-helix transcriptional regulator [Streptomyces sp. TLI_171]|uniref:ArsR/SmtB family transcription factor n=1 Tax=Streptomyces sp. TLI_171 TaxID=1938859 RepID=UPI000C1960DE|nr:winged helix-turn-helix domain-containing protein [Streptomyces sp. TLI_171]RKE22789.1 DNA-binding transcriptional ArsR family regulator [Streptomyces sp. TLI_171]
MDTPPRARALADTAALLADPTRAAICLALLDGRAWTAGELARHAAVAASTASGHLHRLVDAGLLAEERQGRHRYLRLAGPAAAELVEALAQFTGAPPVAARSLRAARQQGELARARTCYDHLAGALGVAVTDAMTARGLLDDRHGLALTPAGADWLTTAGITVRPGRRPAVRACLDFTERRPHLAGAVGAALCRHAVDTGWVEPRPDTRALRVTPAGAAALRGLLGLDW